jgi:hypothetical protein
MDMVQVLAATDLEVAVIINLNSLHIHSNHLINSRLMVEAIYQHLHHYQVVAEAVVIMVQVVEAIMDPEAEAVVIMDLEAVVIMVQVVEAVMDLEAEVEAIMDPEAEVVAVMDLEAVVIMVRVVEAIMGLAAEVVVIMVQAVAAFMDLAAEAIINLNNPNSPLMAAVVVFQHSLHYQQVVVMDRQAEAAAVMDHRAMVAVVIFQAFLVQLIVIIMSIPGTIIFMW